MINTQIEDGACTIEQHKFKHFTFDTSKIVANTFNQSYSTYCLLSFVKVPSHPYRQPIPIRMRYGLDTLIAIQLYRQHSRNFPEKEELSNGNEKKIS
jgi:hypothetical protein